MVVAHPDDESLFGGAQLILEHGWKVVCVTNGDNPTRRAEFEAVMRATDSQFEMWDLYDEIQTPLSEVYLTTELTRVITERQWTKIVTHNSVGEYGHIHHIQIHCLMKQLVLGDLWTFNFDSPILLSDDVWEQKLKLIDFYKSQKHICDEHIKNVRNERITRGNLLHL